MLRVFQRRVRNSSLLMVFIGSLLIVGDSLLAKPVYSNSHQVRLVRTPNDGIQPQAIMDERGVLHLIYFSGEPAAGNIFYVRREPGKNNFSSPLQVNSQPGSAIAIGTIRGAHLSIGKGGRVHVSWNGSKNAMPRGPVSQAPMLYTRMNDAKTAFEPERNVMQFSGGLDGGGSVAADQKGNVYVAWHGKGSVEGEAHRRVWIARSADEGKTFARETPAFAEETGACGCCGLRLFADRQGNVQMLYRAATEDVNRDMMLLTSKDQAKGFSGVRLDKWKLSTCPMSSASIADGLNETLYAWENQGQVYYSALKAGSSKAPKLIAAPGKSEVRKHPTIATNTQGETILVWTEGTGWKRGGSLAWQAFNQSGNPLGEKGEALGVPVWGLATVVAEKDGGFTIIY